MNKKVVAIALTCAMLLTCVVGGTLAWLTDKTDTVTNTFTIGDIEITLGETTGNSYDFVPGDTISKDPKVTVAADSEACYLFVNVIEANNEPSGLPANQPKVINYTVDSAWTAVPGHDGYYYIEVSAEDAATGKSWYVLTDNQVTVNTQVTETIGEVLEADTPTISFKAAAVQRAHIDSVAAAWEELPAEFKPAP